MSNYNPSDDSHLKTGTPLYWKTMPSGDGSEPPVTKFLWRPRNYRLGRIENLEQTPYMMPFCIKGVSKLNKKYWHFPYAVFLYPPSFKSTFKDWCQSVAKRNAYYVATRGLHNEIIWKGGGDEGGLISPGGIRTVRRELGESSLVCADLLASIESSATIGSLLAATNHDDDPFVGPLTSLCYSQVVRSVTGLGLDLPDSIESSLKTIDEYATTPQNLQHLEVARQVVGIDTKYQIRYLGTYPEFNGKSTCGGTQDPSS